MAATRETAVRATDLDTVALDQKTVVIVVEQHVAARVIADATDFPFQEGVAGILVQPEVEIRVGIRSPVIPELDVARP